MPRFKREGSDKEVDDERKAENADNRAKFSAHLTVVQRALELSERKKKSETPAKKKSLLGWD